MSDHPLPRFERSIVADLHYEERRLGSFLEALHAGWRDGDGRAMPVDGLRDRLVAEVRRMRQACEVAEAALAPESVGTD